MIMQKKIFNFSKINTSLRQNILYIVLCNQKDDSVQNYFLISMRHSISLSAYLIPQEDWGFFSFYYRCKINCMLNKALINLNLAHLNLIFSNWLISQPQLLF